MFRGLYNQILLLMPVVGNGRTGVVTERRIPVTNGDLNFFSQSVLIGQGIAAGGQDHCGKKKNQEKIVIKFVGINFLL